MKSLLVTVAVWVLGGYAARAADLKVIAKAGRNINCPQMVVYLS
jgi:hypothetical protein